MVPVLYEVITSPTLTADKTAIIPLNGAGVMNGMMEVFDQLGIRSVGLADFDCGPNHAVKHRLIDKDSAALRAYLSQICEMENNDTDIKIGDDGRPTKKRKKKPPQVYAEWVATNAGNAIAKSYMKN